MTKVVNIPNTSQFEEVDLSRKTIDKVALIDADRFKYIIVHNVFYELDMEGEEYSKNLVDRCIESCLERYVFNRYEAKAYVFCFSCPSSQTFRHLLTNERPYKGNRKKRDDPYFYDHKFKDMAYVYKYINRSQISILKKNLEADDIISLVQNDHTFVHSIDKDMRQVPGTHYDEESHSFVEVTEEEAFNLILKQVLTGDNTDNIPGLKGFGPKSFEKITKFEKEQLLQQTISPFISKHGLLHGLDMFVEMYNLVSLKKRRGEYCNKIYKDIISLINSLI